MQEPTYRNFVFTDSQSGLLLGIKATRDLDLDFSGRDFKCLEVRGPFVMRAPDQEVSYRPESGFIPVELDESRKKAIDLLKQKVKTLIMIRVNAQLMEASTKNRLGRKLLARITFDPAHEPLIGQFLATEKDLLLSRSAAFFEEMLKRVEDAQDIATVKNIYTQFALNTSLGSYASEWIHENNQF